MSIKNGKVGSPEGVDEHIKKMFNSMQEHSEYDINSGEKFYHYTGNMGLYGILASESFWATDSIFLNDSSEQAFGEKLLKDAIKEAVNALKKTTDDEKIKKINLRIKSTFETLGEKRSYIVSFCENGDLLSQWRGYAGSSGFSMGFDYEFFIKSIASNGFPNSPIEWDFLKVLYGDDAKNLAKKIASFVIEEALILESNNNEVFTRFSDWDFFTPLNTIDACYQWFTSIVKHEGFSEEKEWRLIGQEIGIPEIKIRNSNNEIIPYIEFKFPLDFYLNNENFESLEFEVKHIKDGVMNDSEEDYYMVDEPIEKDGLKYLKEIIIGPSSNFNKSKRSVEELIRKNNYSGCSQYNDLIKSNNKYTNEKKCIMSREMLNLLRSNSIFNMPEVKKSDTPLI